MNELQIIKWIATTYRFEIDIMYLSAVIKTKRR